jgi:hypothetical protein
MQTRKLKDGRNVEEFETRQTLKVNTKCPQKWKLVDMETGEEYEGHHPNNTDGFSWKKINA